MSCLLDACLLSALQLENEVSASRHNQVKLQHKYEESCLVSTRVGLVVHVQFLYMKCLFLVILKLSYIVRASLFMLVYLVIYSNLQVVLIRIIFLRTETSVPEFWQTQYCWYLKCGVNTKFTNMYACSFVDLSSVIK